MVRKFALLNLQWETTEMLLNKRVTWLEVYALAAQWKERFGGWFKNERRKAKWKALSPVVWEEMKKSGWVNEDIIWVLHANFTGQSGVVNEKQTDIKSKISIFSLSNWKHNGIIY